MGLLRIIFSMGLLHTNIKEHGCQVKLQLLYMLQRVVEGEVIRDTDMSFF
jgi:hypothetical protein